MTFRSRQGVNTDMPKAVKQPPEARCRGHLSLETITDAEAQKAVSV
jgi:hypothetical protein